MTTSNKPLVPRVAVGSLCSPLEVGANRAPPAAQDLARLLKAAGCDALFAPSPEEMYPETAKRKTQSEARPNGFEHPT